MDTHRMSKGVEVTPDLRQVACVAKHKRHLVYRTGPQTSEGCVWCGVLWNNYLHYGELVRVYDNNTEVAVDIPNSNKTVDYPKTDLATLVNL